MKAVYFFKLKVFFLFLITGISFSGFSQGPIPSVGTNFWLGFMSNYNNTADALNLFISGTSATSGTVDIPLQGWNTTFNVVPGTTTVITIPNNVGLNNTNDVLSGYGIHVQTNDTVSVFSINFQAYTADGAMILPMKSLGTDYLASSYASPASYGASEFLIVATSNGTQVEITPTALTLGGHAAGVPYIVNLNEGQTYQVKSYGDLTGSKITGTTISGDCRPFALFSGVECANIPLGCTACDHIYDQNYSIDSWGTKYYFPPFLNSTSYTFRVMARDNGTTVTLDNGSTITLNSGQFITYNSVPDDQVISADKPIAVIQYMEGDACSGGDPSMIVLNSEERKINDVTFSTISSSVITSHSLNIIVESSQTSLITLDGALIGAGNFTPFGSDPLKSFARIPISQGSHNLNLDAGFTAYVYGLGSAESYAYSVGSFLPGIPVNVDTAYCTSDSVVLASTLGSFNPWWSTQSNPTDTISTGNILVLHPPYPNEVYIATSSSFVSGCVEQLFYSVESPIPPVLSVSVISDTVCPFTDVQFNLTINPISSSYNIEWEPAYLFEGLNTQNPVINIQESGWYKVTVSTLSGCGSASDSIYVKVSGGSIGGVKDVIVSSDKSIICVPDTAQLNVDILQILEFEDFNGGTNPALWNTITGGITADSCGSISGDALYFNGGGPRRAQTQALDVSQGGTIEFFLEIANGTAPCENADFGENVLLQYSINGGANWITINTYFENIYPNFTLVNASIPAGAQTASTMFRWVQPSFTAADQDVWSIDNVSISTYNSTGVGINWTPPGTLSATNIQQPLAFPTNPGWYVVDVTSGVCIYTDSIYIDAAPAFTLQTSNDNILCSSTGIQIQTVASNTDLNTYSWSPSISLTNPSANSTIANPNSTTNYIVTVSSPQGCVVRDSVLISVMQKVGYELSGIDSICIGSQLGLEVINKRSSLYDDFDGATVNPAMWANVNNAALNTDCGSVTGNALHFDQNFNRIAQTNALNTLPGGQISFSLIIGSGVSPCEDANAGFDIYLEYSTDGGFNWINMGTYVTNSFATFTTINVPIPAAAMTSSTMYRWVQYSYWGSGWDNWALDDIFIDVSSPLTNYSTEWYNGSTLISSVDSVQVTPVQATTYTFVLTDTVSHCSVTDSITIHAGPVFALNTTNDISLCSINPVNLSTAPSLFGNYSYSWTPSASLTNPSGQATVGNPTGTTVYYVEVMSDLGCTVTDSVEVYIASQLTRSITGDTTICSGVPTNLELTLLANLSDDFEGGVANPQLWSTVNNALLSNPCGSVSGNSLYFNQNSNRIAQTNALNTSSGGQIVFSLVFGTGSSPCENADAGENVALEYSIDGGANWITIATYLESVYTSFTQVTETIPAAAMTGSTMFRWRQLMFSGSGTDNWALDNVSIEFQSDLSNYMVEWYDDNNILVSSTYPLAYTPLTSTTFTVVLTDTVANCQSIDTVNLNILTLTANAGNDTILCSGSNLTLHGSTSSLAPLVSWNHATNLSNSAILTPTVLQDSVLNYVLSITEGSCTVRDTVSVSYYTIPHLINQSNINICVGDTADLILGGGFNFSWTNAASVINGNTNHPMFDPILTTTYELTYSYANNCTNTDTITVTAIDYPSISFTDSLIKCPESSVLLNPVYTNVDLISWSTSASIPNITVQNPGIYWVDGTNGCATVRDTIVIENYLVEQIDLGNDTTVCDQEFVDIQPVFAASSSFTWSNASPLLNQHLQAPVNLSIIVQDINSCFTYDTIAVSGFPILSVTLGPDQTFCNYENLGLTPNLTNQASYLWSTGETTPTIVVNQEGTYSLILTDFNNCRYFDTVFADEIIAPLPVITGNVAFCPGLETYLSVNNVFFQYLWSDGSTSQSISIGAPSQKVWVRATDQYSCVGSDTVTISEINLPVMDLGPDLIICPDEFAQLKGQVPGAINYQWSNGLINPNIYAGLGTYTLVADYQGCFIGDSIVVSYAPPPTLDLGSGHTICPEEEISIEAQASFYDSLIWSDGSRNLIYVQSQNYQMFDTVRVMATAYGCGNTSDTVEIYVENCYCIVYIPNTFTPDGNNFNNTFQITHLCDFSFFEMLIFNRWGEIIFSTNDPNFEWNGLDNEGELIQDGAYTWRMRYQSLENIEDVQLVEKVGHILILK